MQRMDVRSRRLTWTTTYAFAIVRRKEQVLVGGMASVHRPSLAELQSQHGLTLKVKKCTSLPVEC